MNFQEVMENRKSSEPWLSMHYNDVESEEASEERRLLFADHDDWFCLLPLTPSRVTSVAPRDSGGCSSLSSTVCFVQVREARTKLDYAVERGQVKLLCREEEGNILLPANTTQATVAIVYCTT